MKKLLLILIFLLPVLSEAQSAMTVREIFDFNVNDEFQWSGTNNSSPPPSAQRIKIVGKYFSSGGDTIFYIEQYNNYTSYFNCCPSPHLDYTFYTGTDTVSYTNLDSLFSVSAVNDSCNIYNDTLYYSPQFCGAEIYKSQKHSTCNFYGEDSTRAYGKGLGHIEEDFSYPHEGISETWSMFYYKKDTVVCGTPDLTTEVSPIENNLKFFFSPNPAHGKLNVEWFDKLTNSNLPNGSTGSPTAELKIYDMMGREVMSRKIGNQKLEIGIDFSPGIYFVRVSGGEKTAVQKLVIE